MEGAYDGWPPGVRAAVSLTFDDALPSQLDRALPLLDAAGLRATFYVNPTEAFERELERWRAAAADGHELGNHSLRHPCSGSHGFVGRGNALELWTLDDIEADVLEAGARLRDLVPGDARRTFAYPCGQTFVGRGAGHRSYVPVIARHFAVARGVGETANDPRIADIHCLSSWMVAGATGAELVALAEPALETGRWPIFCFHGIDDGGRLSVGAGALETLLDDLAGRPDVWTDTVQAVGEYLRETI
jgi:peptidoglycan-N-acetylglucosamine deacetylase